LLSGAAPAAPAPQPVKQSLARPRAQARCLAAMFRGCHSSAIGRHVRNCDNLVRVRLAICRHFAEQKTCLPLRGLEQTAHVLGGSQRDLGPRGCV
jgi:hypothetical protein